uniref:Uncharacterized protein n=2 Tax=Rhizophora mucronata TaxID=61149 RepID=A0A2P2II55_RHIMU
MNEAHSPFQKTIFISSNRIQTQSIDRHQKQLQNPKFYLLHHIIPFTLCCPESETGHMLSKTGNETAQFISLHPKR